MRTDKVELWKIAAIGAGCNSGTRPTVKYFLDYHGEDEEVMVEVKKVH